MNFSNIEFFVTEALTGIRRSGMMAVVAIGIVIVSLTIFGAFLLGMANIQSLVTHVGSKIEVAAYAPAALTLEQAGRVQAELSRIPGVAQVTYLSREEAWEEFKKDLGGRLELDEVLRENPLPNTFIIRADAPELTELVARRVAQHSQIEEVRYSNRLVDQLMRFSDAMRLTGLGLILLFGLATLLIVVNTIRLTVISRETDISIMRLVGATHAFIQWPFIIEGVLMGMLGGGLAIISLKFGYDLVQAKLAEALPFLPLLRAGIKLTLIYGAVLLTGIFLTTLGAFVSVRKTLGREG